MKKIYVVFIGVLMCLGAGPVQAQDIYMIVYTYGTTTNSASFPGTGSGSGTILTKGLGTASGTVKDVAVGKTLDLSNYVKLTSVQYDLEQTLNIGSQATGAGAGKVTFNPIVITKAVDAISPVLMQNCASGTPFTIEIVFVPTTGAVATKNIIYKLQIGLAAVKTVSVSSVPDCGSGCMGIAESYSFDYGQLIVQTYKQDATGVYSAGPRFGWDRVKNVSTNQ